MEVFLWMKENAANGNVCGTAKKNALKNAAVITTTAAISFGF